MSTNPMTEHRGRRDRSWITAGSSSKALSPVISDVERGLAQQR